MPERETEQEKLLFYTLCSDRDYNMLSGLEEMSCRDFERITYILETIELWYYCAEVTQHFQFQFHQCSQEIEHGLLSKKQFQGEVAEYTKWLADFLNQLPTSVHKWSYGENIEIN